MFRSYSPRAESRSPPLTERYFVSLSREIDVTNAVFITGVRRVRTIVFHGANDKIVNPSNAEAILADVRAALSEPAQELLLDGVAGGRAYTRTIVTDARGVPHAECWAIDGLGHAWSGVSLRPIRSSIRLLGTSNRM